MSGRTIIKPPQFTQQPSSDDEYEDDEEYEEGDEEYEEDEEDDGAYHGVDNDDEDYVEDGLDNGDGVTVKDLMHNNSMLLAFGNDMKEKHDVMQQQHLSQMKELERLRAELLTQAGAAPVHQSAHSAYKGLGFTPAVEAPKISALALEVVHGVLENERQDRMLAEEEAIALVERCRTSNEHRDAQAFLPYITAENKKAWEIMNPWPAVKAWHDARNVEGPSSAELALAAAEESRVRAAVELERAAAAERERLAGKRPPSADPQTAPRKKNKTSTAGLGNVPLNDPGWSAYEKWKEQHGSKDPLVCQLVNRHREPPRGSVGSTFGGSNVTGRGALYFPVTDKGPWLAEMTTVVQQKAAAKSVHAPKKVFVGIMRGIDLTKYGCFRDNAKEFIKDPSSYVGADAYLKQRVLEIQSEEREDYTELRRIVTALAPGEFEFAFPGERVHALYVDLTAIYIVFSQRTATPLTIGYVHAVLDQLPTEWTGIDKVTFLPSNARSVLKARRGATGDPWLTYDGRKESIPSSEGEMDRDGMERWAGPKDGRPQMERWAFFQRWTTFFDPLQIFFFFLHYREQPHARERVHGPYLAY